MKKKLFLVSLVVLLVVLLSSESNAALSDVFNLGFNSLENFFGGGWRTYEKTVAFIVFFFLFFSTYLIGIKNYLTKIKASEKGLNRPYMVFAFTAALLSSFIVTTSIRFDWVNLEYVALGLIGLLALFLLHSLFSKLFEKHKFLAFLLALLAAGLLLWLIWFLANEGRALGLGGGLGRGLGKTGDWLRNVGRKGPSKDILPEGKPITPEVTGGKAEVKEGGGFTTFPPGYLEGGKLSWWLLLLIILLLFFIFGLIARWKKPGEEDRKAPPRRGIREGTIDGVIFDLKRISKWEDEVAKRIESLEEKKEGILNEIPMVVDEINKI